MTKCLSIFSFAILSMNAVASAPRNPADYTIKIHVTASRTTPSGLVIYAVIDSKPVQLLEGQGDLLLPGDYPAKLKAAGSKAPSYRVDRHYEMLLPDGNVSSLHQTCVGPVCASDGLAQ